MQSARHSRFHGGILLGICFLIRGFSAQLTATGCGTTKGCFQNPTGCSPSSSSCKFVSWIYDATKKEFTFEISGATTGQYVAVAFTLDDGMSNADGYICTGEKQLISTKISTTTLPTDDAELPTGVSLVSVSNSNGLLQCTFKRPATVTKTTSDVSRKFSLDSQKYRMLVANGNTQPPSGKTVVTYHSSRIKSKPTSFTSFAGSGSSGVSGLVKAHGALMILAWLMLVNIGGVIARHFKPTWPGVQVAGKDVWFQIHRGVMVTAVLLTLIAFIIIFVSVNGWVGEHAVIHGTIGIVVTILALINPIMAIFRPHPGTPKRFVFNWAHWFVGSCARILSLANLFLGVGLQTVVKMKWTTWVLVAFVVVHVIFELIFELLTWKGKSEPIAQENFDMSADQNAAPKKTPEKFSAAKTGLLMLYVVGNFGISICLFVAIGNI